MRKRVCLRSSAEIGYGKVVQGYNKMIAIIAFYFIILTQILKRCTHSILCELEINVGNSGKVSGDEGMRRCQLGFFYTILMCLSNIWEYKHRLWLLLIIDGLWRRDKVFKNKDKGIYQLTFWLIISLRHNNLRDITYELLSEVCKGVENEPMLQPLTGETLKYQTAKAENNARLDVSALGFWCRNQGHFSI